MLEVDVLDRVRSALASRYTVLDQVGRGGWAKVYAAEDKRNRRRVAIKVLDPTLAQAVGTDRFMREIEIAANLHHPNIVPLYDSGEAEGLLYYVMPYVEGETLADHLEREGQLPFDEALAILRDVCEALTYAHEHGVVHRDIKPSNILLTSGRAMVSDFGLALAVSQLREAIESGSFDSPTRLLRPDSPSARRITDPGIAVGTVDYISPEQAHGSQRIDARADIYSLGCVWFEMLAGDPPFHGSNAQAVVARHISEEPPRVRVVRPQMPQQVDAVIRKALAKSPADRYRSAKELFAAVSAPARPGGSRALWILATGVSAAAAALALWCVQPPPAPPLDSKLFVVLPHRHVEEAAPPLLDGTLCARLIESALGLWDDVNVVDPIRLGSALQARGDIRSRNDAINLARQLGAGRLIWGDVTEILNGLLIRATLYDVAANADIRTAEARMPIPSADVGASSDLMGSQFDSLTSRLLTGTTDVPDRASGAVRTRSLGAWLSYQAGHNSVEHWNLGAAAEEFRRAVAQDTTYAQAYLWSAQVDSWRTDQIGEWSRYAHADKALTYQDGLSVRERGYARALSALASEEFAQACDEYQQLVDANTLDFRAWFGLGQCHFLDRAVVPDPNSPSNHAFRGSRHTSLRSFRQALALAPAIMGAFRSAAYERVQHFIMSGSDIRWGALVDSPSQVFGSWAELNADTIAYVPYPEREVLISAPGVLPSTHSEAVVRIQTDIADIIANWVEAFPESYQAREAQARVLENLNRIELVIPNARDALANALRLAPTRLDSLRLSNHEIRLLLKLKQWRLARLAAERMLNEVDVPLSGEAQFLAVAAAVTGAPNRTADLLQTAHASSPREYFHFHDSLPVADLGPLAAGAARLNAYAAFGEPADSVRAAVELFERRLRYHAETADRQRVLRASLSHLFELAFPVTGLTPAHVNSQPPGLRPLQVALVERDTAIVRTALDAFRGMRSTQRRGETSTDRVLREAWLYLALGDTTTAIGEIQQTLDAIPTMTDQLTKQVEQTVALVRLMALRAHLAAARNDTTALSWWASPVIELWSRTPSVEIRQQVDRLRSLIRAN